MIDLSAMNEWQNRDPQTGLVFPWYTKTFLDELVTWDLKDKKVVELGGGASTLWWNKRAETVITIESSREWCDALSGKGVIVHADNKDNYIGWAEGAKGFYDIVVIDCEPIEWRDDCVKPAIHNLKPGGKLIIDNWDQPSVGWLPSEETKQLLSQYPIKIYKQEGHPDWATAVFTMP